MLGVSSETNPNLIKYCRYKVEEAGVLNTMTVHDVENLQFLLCEKYWKRNLFIILYFNGL